MHTHPKATAASRRQAVAAIALGWARLSFGAAAFPSAPLQIIVPGSAGSVLDHFGRRLAGPLQRELGVPVLLLNRPGASGVPAAEAVARARKDGHTLLLAGLNLLCINPALMPRLPYDPARDFAPISLIATGHPLLLAAPGLGVSTLAELLGPERRGDRVLRFGSPGLGSVQHLAARLLAERTGLRLVVAHYASQPQTLTDLVGGHVDLAIDYPSLAMPLVRGGRLRPLAVLGPARTAALPGTATAAEQGVEGIEAAAWSGLVAPAGTPAVVVERIRLALHVGLQAPDFVAWVEANGSKVTPTSASAFGQLIAADRARWSRVVRAAGISVD